MAEAFAKLHGKEVLLPHSAGIKPAGFIHPQAIAVMSEVGLDLRQHESKPIDQDILRQMDWVVTMSDEAKAVCASLPQSIHILHWVINDPVRVLGKGDRVLKAFQLTRDKIEAQVKEFIETIKRL